MVEREGNRERNEEVVDVGDFVASKSNGFEGVILGDWFRQS